MRFNRLNQAENIGLTKNFILAYPYNFTENSKWIFFYQLNSLIVGNDIYYLTLQVVNFSL